MADVRFPNVNVQLVGQDGNAFSILARVSKALRHGGVSSDEIKKFFDEATASDYQHLLQVVLAWVSVDEEEE